MERFSLYTAVICEYACIPIRLTLSLTSTGKMRFPSGTEQWSMPIVQFKTGIDEINSDWNSRSFFLNPHAEHEVMKWVNFMYLFNYIISCVKHSRKDCSERNLATMMGYWQLKAHEVRYGFPTASVNLCWARFWHGLSQPSWALCPSNALKNFWPISEGSTCRIFLWNKPRRSARLTLN